MVLALFERQREKNTCLDVIPQCVFPLHVRLLETVRGKVSHTRAYQWYEILASLNALHAGIKVLVQEIELKLNQKRISLG